MHKHHKRSLDKDTWEGNSRIVSYTKRDEPSRTSTVCTTGADSGTQFVLVKPDMGLPRIGCPRNQSLWQSHYFFAHTAVIAYRKFGHIMAYNPLSNQTTCWWMLLENMWCPLENSDLDYCDVWTRSSPTQSDWSCCLSPKVLVLCSTLFTTFLFLKPL